MKNNNLKTTDRIKIIAAYVPGALLVIAGARMFLETRGTKLLFLDSATGAIYKNWAIYLTVGILLLAAAVIAGKILAKKLAKPADAPAEAPAPQIAEASAETDKNSRKCTKCGAAIADGAKFCPTCGASVDEGAAQ